MPRSAADSYVHNHSKSPNLYYLRDVPKDVREAIGLSRWKQSLGTANRNEARRKAWQLALEHDRNIAAARAPKLDPLERLSAEQRATIDDAGGLDAYLDWLNRRARDAERHQLEAEDLREWAAEKGPAHEVLDPDWAAARSAGLLVEQKMIHAQIARDLPILSKLELGPTDLNSTGRHHLGEAIQSGIVDPATITLSGAFQRWADLKKPEAPEQYAYPVRLFEDLHGPLPLAQIEKAHIRDFRDVLQKLPRGGSPGWAKLNLQQMLMEGTAKKLPTIGDSTGAKYFRAIKTLFGFAIAEGYIAHSPTEGIKYTWKRQKISEERRSRRRPLSPDEVRALLGAAERQWEGQPELWFVRLFVYSGARPEELAQLSPSDIRDSDAGLYLRIHDEGDNRLKSTAALRVVPVHPELLRLGFGEFVKSRSAEGRLFPFASTGTKRRYANFQRRLANLMRSHACINDPRAVPYSVRHTFKDCMRLIGAPEEVVERIMGHTTPERAVARGYGNPDQVRLLAPWLGKIDPLDPRRAVETI